LQDSPFRPIDLVDHAEQELSHHELTGPESRKAGGAASGREGAGNVRDLGFALPLGCIRHSICRGHVAGK